ncbi:PGPGW domain-containing protein [bacterium]|nr:PGPGW domain-containing protein [bacterium]MBU1985265.1 PGPGW domain-containing protein [bacterium]
MKAPHLSFRIALRWVRILLGFSVLALGFIMVVTPGPAIVVIPVGLAILATEYAWARRYLKRFKEGGEKLGTIFFHRHGSAKTASPTMKDK